jgi:hypothetical protein
VAVYAVAVAPTIGMQFVVHRSHWNWKTVGLPSHVPASAVSMAPTAGRPETAGAVRPTGGRMGAAARAEAAPMPAAFWAATLTASWTL